jgi:hypothetical protein
MIIINAKYFTNQVTAFQFIRTRPQSKLLFYLIFIGPSYLLNFDCICAVVLNVIGRKEMGKS